MPQDAQNTRDALSAFTAQRLARGGAGAEPERLREFLPLARTALERLGRYLPPDIEPETLEGRAILALVEAADQMPPSAVGFESYARLRIWRAITDCLRQSQCFMAEAHSSLGRLSEATDRALRVGLSAAEEELAALLAEPIEELREALEQVAALMAAAPQAVLGMTGDHSHLEHRIARAVCALPKLEQIVVAMYYFEDLTFGEIAKVLDMTEQQVQWIFGRAAVLLRIHLCRRFPEEAAA